MAFFKHKEEDKSQLPQLPGLPEMPELPPLPQSSVKTEIKPLPTLQKNSFEDAKAIGAIKTSVSEPLSNPAEKRTIEISDLNSAKAMQMVRPIVSANKDVFVKIEKFQEAVKKFEEIKIKVNDIEKSLSVVRELKDKEEQELKAWEQEVQMIKDKVNNIDNSLFSRI
jgi:hypothetical protein